MRCVPEMLLSRCSATRLFCSRAQVLETNFNGAIMCTEAFLPLMTPASTILFTSSSAGTRFLASDTLSPFAAQLKDEALTVDGLRALVAEIVETGCLGSSDDAYAFSKTCVNAYAQIFARERGDFFVKAVSPGFTRTGMCEGWTGKRVPKEADLGATVFVEAIDGVGKGRTGVFVKQASEAGTKLEAAQSVITDWCT